MELSGAKIVLGVCGSIAAYKAVSLGRGLLRCGAQLRVAMTHNAAKFVSPLTFRCALDAPVVVDQFAEPQRFASEHISWARWADLFLVAPATADVLAKAACGIADEFLTTAMLATEAPVAFVPAMNEKMFTHPATQRNIRVLEELGYYVMSPASGALACGEEGVGRFPEQEQIISFVESLLFESDALRGIRIVVTAGPTREFLDPVRFLSNPSTGRMGVALADVARRMGAKVTLVHGPLSVAPPNVEKTVEVTTARQMLEAVEREFEDADVLIMAAAVADYAPKSQSAHKIKKTSQTLSLELVRTPDILKRVAERKGERIVVGFALETDDVVENARRKLFEKGLDLVVANVVSAGSGFAAETNEVFVISPSGDVEHIPRAHKRVVAREVLLRVAELVKEKRGRG